MIMTHSDNQGLILPPFVAQIQIVVIPIFGKNDDIEGLKAKASELAS